MQQHAQSYLIHLYNTNQLENTSFLGYDAVLLTSISQSFGCITICNVGNHSPHDRASHPEDLNPQNVETV